MAVLVGCLGDDPKLTRPLADAGPTDSGASCTRRSGTFVSRFAEARGTCGPYRAITNNDETTESYTEQPTQPAAPCVGVLRASGDNCVTTIETSCPSTLATGTVETKGELRWNSAGTSASGELEVTTSTCRSTYRVDVERR